MRQWTLAYHIQALVEHKKPNRAHHEFGHPQHVQSYAVTTYCCRRIEKMCAGPTKRSAAGVQMLTHNRRKPSAKPRKIVIYGIRLEPNKNTTIRAQTASQQQIEPPVWKSATRPRAGTGKFFSIYTTEEKKQQVICGKHWSYHEKQKNGTTKSTPINTNVNTRSTSSKK